MLNLFIIGFIEIEISILIPILTLGKAKLTASIRHIATVLESGISIYNSKIPDKAARKIRKRRKRRTQAIVKRYEFHTNAIKPWRFHDKTMGI